MHHHRTIVPMALILLAASACRHSGDNPVSDIHSFANPASVRVTHAQIRWDLDFPEKRLRGVITWMLDRRDQNAPLVLDTKFLDIENVRAGTVEGLRTVSYTHGGGDEVLGTPLVVPLGLKDDRVEIRYRTLPGGACLQWLSPNQTADGTQPFVFSQAQSINARAMLPCQDSPGVRFTYEAQVKAPPGIRPVLAAEDLGERTADGAFRFRMEEPIPSYLVAIAAGDIAFKPMGPRTGVWAEPSVLDKAAWEFADTERMMEVAEELYGPYRWGRYDIIILPPSFPFGGMENPRLTFATPTVLAGDRSQTSLVAHELAHSWSGNLVTNATWSDFWLNEGFTVYFERRIMEAVYGADRAEMEAVLGRQDLLSDMRELPEGDTVLHVDLTGRDPDDAFSNVPYEKGYLFLRLLDETFGRDRLDPFLKSWFDSNAFESRTTSDFEAWMDEHLFGDGKDAGALLVEAWLHSPGLPTNAPTAESEAFQACAKIAARVARGKLAPRDMPAAKWITHQWLHFLRSLPEEIESDVLTALDEAWSLTETGNSEILCAWSLVAIRNGYSPANAATERFLVSQGRRKFLKPIYQAMARTKNGRARALEIYKKARDRYHQIAVNTIDEILGYGK